MTEMHIAFFFSGLEKLFAIYHELDKQIKTFKISLGLIAFGIASNVARSLQKNGSLGIGNASAKHMLLPERRGRITLEKNSRNGY